MNYPYRTDVYDCTPEAISVVYIARNSSNFSCLVNKDAIAV